MMFVLVSALTRRQRMCVCVCASVYLSRLHYDREGESERERERKTDDNNNNNGMLSCRRVVFLFRSMTTGASSHSRHQDDMIVTPFAQLLASLKNVRKNLIDLTHIPPDRFASASVRVSFHPSTMLSSVQSETKSSVECHSSNIAEFQSNGDE